MLPVPGRNERYVKGHYFWGRREPGEGMSNEYVVRVQGEKAEPRTRVHKTPVLPLGDNETRTQTLSTGFQQSNRLEFSHFLSTIPGHGSFAKTEWREQNGFCKPITT